MGMKHVHAPENQQQMGHEDSAKMGQKTLGHREVLYIKPFTKSIPPCQINTAIKRLKFQRFVMNSNHREMIGTLGYIWNHKLVSIGGVKLSLGNMLVALILLLFATRLSRLAARQINRRLILPFVPDKASQTTYQTFVFYGCLAAFVTLSLTIAGIPLTVFTVIGGALAIGVGFGSQNIVNNFISGIILLMEQPVRVGDVVELDSISGTVVSIGTRSTKIKNGDNKVFIVPNSFFLEKSVLNWSYQTSVLRTTIPFGVAYGSDVHLIEKICMDILQHTEGVEGTPEPKVLFNDFGDSNLNFELVFYCDIDKVSSLGEVRSHIRFKMEERFKNGGIEMAYPHRDVMLKLDRALDVKILS